MDPAAPHLLAAGRSKDGPAVCTCHMFAVVHVCGRVQICSCHESEPMLTAGLGVCKQTMSLAPAAPRSVGLLLG
jgi:hypothetical protein